MDGLMFYHSNANGEELSVIDDIIALDFENNIGVKATEKDNSFSMTMSESYWAKIPVQNGDGIYIPGTEWGGIVSNVEHKTTNGSVTVSGLTWRGILHCIIVEPPSGQSYLVVSNVDANVAIGMAIGSRYTSLIKVSTAVCGVNVSGEWRYRTVADCLNTTLASYGLRLKIVWDNTINKMVLSAEPVDELTDQIELSQDYGVDFTSSDGNSYLRNRCLALGSGTGENRLVRNYYYWDGDVVTTKPSGWDDEEERTILLDYPNAEDENQLYDSARKRLLDYSPKKSIVINQINVDVSTDLGDIIGARDRLTGMVGESRVVKKIMSLKSGTIKIDMGVE